LTPDVREEVSALKGPATIRTPDERFAALPGFPFEPH